MTEDNTNKVRLPGVEISSSIVNEPINLNLNGPVDEIQKKMLGLLLKGKKKKIGMGGEANKKNNDGEGKVPNEEREGVVIDAKGGITISPHFEANPVNININGSVVSGKKGLSGLLENAGEKIKAAKALRASLKGGQVTEQEESDSAETKEKLKTRLRAFLEANKENKPLTEEIWRILNDPDKGLIQAANEVTVELHLPSLSGEEVVQEAYEKLKGKKPAKRMGHKLMAIFREYATPPSDDSGSASDTGKGIDPTSQSPASNASDPSSRVAPAPDASALAAQPDSVSSGPTAPAATSSTVDSAAPSPAAPTAPPASPPPSSVTPSSPPPSSPAPTSASLAPPPDAPAPELATVDTTTTATAVADGPQPARTEGRARSSAGTGTSTPPRHRETPSPDELQKAFEIPAVDPDNRVRRTSGGAEGTSISQQPAASETRVPANREPHNRNDGIDIQTVLVRELGGQMLPLSAFMHMFNLSEEDIQVLTSFGGEWKLTVFNEGGKRFVNPETAKLLAKQGIGNVLKRKKESLKQD